MKTKKKKKKSFGYLKRYIEKVLEYFNMSKTKPIVSLLTSHFKFSSKKCPTSEKDQEDM